MRRILPFIILFLSLGTVSLKSHAAPSFQNETLKYVVSYKWGLIHKDAGDVTLTLRKNSDVYNLRMVASSRPWADKLYRVRDTLMSTMRTSDLKPISYEKRMHERDKYAVDKIKFNHGANSTTGKAVKYRYNKDGNTVKETNLSATGPVYDFLSIFYYLRKLDYSQLNKYKSYQASLFSGSKKETVTIKSLGLEKIKLKDKREVEAYHIRFRFTQKGGKKSSDDIDTWISTDSSHVPLYLVGRLPIGEIRVNLVSQS